MSKTRAIDALMCRSQGRLPVLEREYKGYRIITYRVGRRHEYQALAARPDGPETVGQTRRASGPGARTIADYEAQRLIGALLGGGKGP